MAKHTCSLEERFWAKVDRGDPDGCWLWTAAINPKGYAMFAVTKGVFGATGKQPIGGHRVAYQLMVGPIPEGLQLDHLCRVRHCVNPAHLQPVTRKENILRGTSPTAQHAAKTHCPKGHPYAGDNLQFSHGSRVCRICHNAHASRSYYTRKKRLAQSTDG